MPGRRKNMFLNLTNHPSALWSIEQMTAAQQYGKVMDMPFPNVPPDMDESGVEKMAQEIYSKVKALQPDIVMCQGEMTLTYSLVRLFKEAGIKTVAACSERCTQERQKPDGSTEKTAVFMFRQFRNY